jgi:hypothetical protein
MTKLSTIDDVIRMFDGPARAARWAGVTDNAVCLWRTRGRIPPSTHLRLIIAAKRKGYVIGREILQLEEDEWQELYELLPDDLKDASEARRPRAAMNGSGAVA